MDQGNSKLISLYLVRDAALIVRNRPNGDGDAGIREQRTELGDALLRLGLAHCTGTVATDWQIGRSAAGGPVVLQNDLHLSLSHSGDYLVAGICNAAPIGIDIERHQERPFTKIAQHLDWPGGTWDPPGSLKADGFYHLWTLWEAAIKSCSSMSGVQAESVFRLIIPALTAGTPDTMPAQDWLAGSWQCPGRFWLSIIAADSEVPDIRLFVVNGLESAKQMLQISEITNDDGILDPEIFQ